MSKLSEKKIILGYKMGTFSILTRNHVETFRLCKEQCDCLTVIINDNQYVEEKKGCVTIPEEDRKAILESIKYIDKVEIVHDKDPERFVRSIKNRFGDYVIIVLFHSHEILERSKKDPGYEIPGAKWAD